MRDLIVTALVFGSIPVILRRPWFGIIVWNWLGIMNPHRLTYGFALSMPFAQLIALATFGAVIFSREPKRLPITPVTITLMAFVTWLCVTTPFALVPGAGDGLIKALKIQLIILLGMALLQSRERIRWLAWVLVVSIGFYGVKGGLFTVTGGGQDMVLGPPGTFIEGNTEIGLALVMMLPLMRFLQLDSPNKWVRRGLGVSMILTGISILGTYSRGAFLAGSLMMGFLWMKSRRKLLLAMVMVVLIPVALVAMPDAWWAKMGTIQTYEKDQSAMGRINAWWFAFNLAKSRPLVGGGFEAFDPGLFLTYAPVPWDYHDAHSIYFEVLGEQGFVGLAIFLTLMVVTWRAGSQIIAATKNRVDLRWAYDLATMAQVCLIGYWSGGAFLGLAYFDGYYLIISLIVLTKCVVDRTLLTVGGAVDPSAAALPDPKEDASPQVVR